jgi:radical SAM protein with 4Fe4S-binding SPASM domain
MLDITELNRYLSMRVAPNNGEGEPRLAVISLADYSLPPAETAPKPLVSWRVTRSCNLHCQNCLYDSQQRRYGEELTTAEGLALIKDLAAFGVPRLLFGGGEPLMRPDLLELVACAHELGIQPSIYTNGTLLDRTRTVGLKRAGLHSVTLQLEAIGSEVDRNRRSPGAFQAVTEGYANCTAAGLEVDVRTPLNHWNYQGLAGVLDFIQCTQIRQVVFSHLVYTGRGNTPHDDLTHEEKRRALDLILGRVQEFHRRGMDIKISTDENQVDGIYLFLRLARRNPLRAAAAYRLLLACGAAVEGAGVGIAGIDATGDVHPDPYWANYTLGNVRETPFSAIWEKSSDPLLQGLRDRLPLLKGRCANCRWKQACGGSSRVRAQELFDDPWMSDPACYLTDEEISKEVNDQIVVMEDDVLLPKEAA